MPRSRIIIEFPDLPAYTVRIGGGLTASLGADLRTAGIEAGRCLVVCDADSTERCLPPLKDALGSAGFRVAEITIPSVEPEQVWDCVAELHRAFAQLELPAGTPVVVSACVQVAEIAAFAVATYGGGLALVLAPASLAGVFRTVAVHDLELDAGYPAPVVAPAKPAFAMVDTRLLACAGGEEEALGLDELAFAATWCDADFQTWHAQAAADFAAGDEDTLVLALTQTLAARADAIGREIRSR